MVALTVVTLMLGGAAYAVLDGSETPAAAHRGGTPEPSASRQSGPSTTPSHSPTASASAADPSTTPSAASSARSSKPAADDSTTGPADGAESGHTTIPVPPAGSGTFTTASGRGGTTGQGRTWRYLVQVEKGIALSSEDAATEVADILGHSRGWTRGGQHAFRMVSSGSYDFVVKIATPGTVDAICGAAGLNTRGEVNCRVGEQVVVNLKRWVLGSPEFSGPIGEYRALIINHEVGHRLGRGHEGCPGPGRPAPAMMQQIKGLQGCVPNAWPYSSDGTYLSGPSVP